jgi:hypothetical protein
LVQKEYKYRVSCSKMGQPRVIIQQVFIIITIKITIMIHGIDWVITASYLPSQLQ